MLERKTRARARARTHHRHVLVLRGKEEKRDVDLVGVIVGGEPGSVSVDSGEWGDSTSSMGMGSINGIEIEQRPSL